MVVLAGFGAAGATRAFADTGFPGGGADLAAAGTASDAFCTPPRDGAGTGSGFPLAGAGGSEGIGFEAPDGPPAGVCVPESCAGGGCVEGCATPG